jgi:xylulokinase
MLEATAFGTRHLLEAMHDAGGVGRRFVAVGGGTKGGLWTQIISDAAGITQQLPKQTIGASYGDALLAAMVSGLADQNTTWVSMSDTVEPNPDNRGLYDELYAVYKDLYPATRPMAHTLASIQLR